MVIFTTSNWKGHDGKVSRSIISCSCQWRNCDQTYPSTRTRASKRSSPTAFGTGKTWCRSVGSAATLSNRSRSKNLRSANRKTHDSARRNPEQTSGMIQAGGWTGGKGGILGTRCNLDISFYGRPSPTRDGNLHIRDGCCKRCTWHSESARDLFLTSCALCLFLLKDILGVLCLPKEFASPSSAPCTTKRSPPQQQPTPLPQSTTTGAQAPHVTGH